MNKSNQNKPSAKAGGKYFFPILFALYIASIVPA